MFGSKAIDSDSGSLCEILYCIVVEICERFSDSREMGGAHRERTVVAIRFTLGQFLTFREIEGNRIIGVQHQ